MSDFSDAPKTPKPAKDAGPMLHGARLVTALFIKVGTVRFNVRDIAAYGEEAGQGFVHTGDRKYAVAVGVAELDRLIEGAG